MIQLPNRRKKKWIKRLEQTHHKEEYPDGQNEKVPNILIHLEVDIKVTKTHHHTLSEWLE